MTQQTSCFSPSSPLSCCSAEPRDWAMRLWGNILCGGWFHARCFIVMVLVFHYGTAHIRWDFISWENATGWSAGPKQTSNNRLIVSLLFHGNVFFTGSSPRRVVHLLPFPSLCSFLLFPPTRGCWPHLTLEGGAGNPLKAKNQQQHQAECGRSCLSGSRPSPDDE